MMTMVEQSSKPPPKHRSGWQDLSYRKHRCQENNHIITQVLLQEHEYATDKDLFKQDIITVLNLHLF